MSRNLVRARKNKDTCCISPNYVATLDDNIVLSAEGIRNTSSRARGVSVSAKMQTDLNGGNVQYRKGRVHIEVIYE